MQGTGPEPRAGPGVRATYRPQGQSRVQDQGSEQCTGPGVRAGTETGTRHSSQRTESASAWTIVARRSPMRISVPAGTSTAWPPVNAVIRPSGVRICVPFAENESSIHAPLAVGPTRMCVRDRDTVVSGTTTARDPSAAAGARPRVSGMSISSRWPESKMSHRSCARGGVAGAPHWDWPAPPHCPWAAARWAACTSRRLGGGPGTPEAGAWYCTGAENGG